MKSETCVKRIAARCLQSMLVDVRETVFGLAEAPALLLSYESQPNEGMSIVCLA